MQHGHVLHVHVGFEWPIPLISHGRICMALDRIHI